MSETNSFSDWNKENPQESLDSVYGRATENAENEIEWYERRKKPSRIHSQWLRFFSIVFAAVSALRPLLDATRIVEIYTGAPSNFALGQWGYVFLATAIVGYAFYFGHSSGWMRFVVTEVSIGRLLKEFQIDWTVLEVQQAGNSVDARTLIFLERAKIFTLQIENLVRQETDSWVMEFQANIAQLEKVLKTETKGKQRTLPDTP